MTKAQGPLFHVGFRRRREGVTNYATRLALLKSGTIRAVIRKTSRSITIQFTRFETKGDKVLGQASSVQLSEYGFQGKSNIPSAYLTGLLAGTRAKSGGVKNAIVDFGRQTSTKGNVLYAAVAGIIDSGVAMPISEEMLPAKDRLAGKDSKSASNFEAAKAKISTATPKEAKTAK